MGDSALKHGRVLASREVEVDDGSSLSLARAVLKNWASVVAATILAGGAALVWSKAQPSIYATSAMVELDPHVSHPLGEKMDSIVQYGSGDYWDNQEYYNTQYKIITSDRVLVAAARDLGLQNDWEFLGYKGPPARAVSVETAAHALQGRVSAEPVKSS